jgi:hypothetical protein
MLSAIVLACRVTTLPVATPDWALSRRMEDGGVVMRRYEWHLARAALSSGVAWTLTRVTPMRGRTAAVVAMVSTGVLPHLVGVLRCTYPWDGPDWIADAVIASVPIVALGGGTRLQLAVRIVGFGAAYAVAAPYARP